MDGYHLFTEYFTYRLLINSISMIVLVRYVYFNTYQKRDSFFPFFLLNFVVFLLSFMMEKAKVFGSFSSAFGLLAAFSLLRFRTETITLKDMTYLFITMTLGLINSLMEGSLIEIGALNGMVIGAVYVVDGNRILRNQKSKTIEYPILDNIRPEQQPQLIQDLKQRTGLDIRKITIEHIDFTKSRAVIKIFYY